MKRNIGTIDTLIRVAISLIIAILYMEELITGILALVLGIFAVFLIITGLVGCCTFYKLFDISTVPSPPKKKDEAFTL